MRTELLIKAMLAAADDDLRPGGAVAREYAELEFRKLLLVIQSIRKLRDQGQITKDEAKLLVELQRNAMRSVLLTRQGLGILEAERAINAAMRAIRAAANAAIGGGWKLL